MVILAYSGIELTSKKGLEHLIKFASNNHIDSEYEATEKLISLEEEMAEKSLAEYYDTLRDAMPNCFE